ncbi:MAG: CTP synthase [Clostridia bacterium]
MSKYIFVTGGVVSSLGKGITAASLGRILKDRGLRVNVQKFDPYFNVDPTMMDPRQHGEIFVTEDGCETDLDIGHYERFLGNYFDKNCDFTSGKIYSTVIAKERKGLYNGGTVQVIPHVTNEIKNCMKLSARDDVDVVIIEIGGTVGDIEGLPYLEAIRQFRHECGENGSIHIHVTLLPYIEAAGEVKTKPTQHSVKELTGLGLIPDIIMCRTNKNVELSDELRDKIALFCNLSSGSAVFHNPDCDSIYEVPLLLKSQGLDKIVLSKLKLKAKESAMLEWKKLLKDTKALSYEVKIGVVGKYNTTPDAYISVVEALKHAGLACNTKVKVKLFDAEKLATYDELLSMDGVVFAGGYQARVNEQLINLIKIVRESNLPTLAIGLGMQLMIIELARNKAQMSSADTIESNPETLNPIIKKNDEAVIGAREILLKNDTLVGNAYKTKSIIERYRHFYGFNQMYAGIMEKTGLVFSGEDAVSGEVSFIEYPENKFFVGSLAHIEFKSNPLSPNPLIVNFINCVKAK